MDAVDAGPRGDRDDEVFDVVVVGSGAAGLTAALAAAKRGLSTVVVEKTGYFGGSTAFSGGIVWIPKNPALDQMDLNWDLSRVGLADTLEKGRVYLEATVGDRVPSERREAFLQAGPKMIDELSVTAGLRWMHWPIPDYYAEAPGGMSAGRGMEPAVFDGRRLGAEFARLRPQSPAFTVRGLTMTTKEAVGLSFGPGDRRALTSGLAVARRALTSRLTGAKPVGSGQSLVAHLRHGLQRLNVPIWFDVEVTELITEDQSGSVNARVDGLRVRHGGAVRTLRARRGVILATGGFSRAEDLREKYLPHPTRAEWTLVPEEGQDGDAIALGRAAGGALDLMEGAWGFPAAMLPGKDGRLAPALALYERIKPGVIVVDGNGERYFDEGAPYEEAWHRMYERHESGHPAVPSWMIFDQRAKNRFVMFKVPPLMPFPKRWMRSDSLFKAGSLERVAELAGLPSQNLRNTVERFNGMARRGKDEDFGKGDTAFARFFGERACPHPNLHPIERGPYYAVALYPGDISTKGGLTTDAHARVLREDGSVIAGLYAAGNCSASVMGNSYPGGGGTIAPAMVFGYIAARHCGADQQLPVEVQ